MFKIVLHPGDSLPCPLSSSYAIKEDLHGDVRDNLQVSSKSWCINFPKKNSNHAQDTNERAAVDRDICT